MEGNLLGLKNEIKVIQTTKPSWAVVNKNKLVELETAPGERWGACEERVDCFLKEELNMNTSDISTERAHGVGEKKTDKEGQIVVQLNSFIHKLTILTWKNFALLNSVQKFIEIKGWLLLTFFICLHNQLSSFNSIIV